MTMRFWILRKLRAALHIALLCAICILLFVCIQFNVLGAPSMVIHDLYDRGIQLVPATNSEFALLVDSVLKGKEDSRLEALKNFSVVLRNSANKRIVGYSIKWELTDKLGRRQVLAWQVACPMEVLDGGRVKYDSGMQAGSSIAPRSAAIVMPYANLNSPLDARERVDPQEQQGILAIVDELNSASDITVTLDSVVFEDGVFAGPDTTNFFENFVADFEGHQSLYKDILDAHARGAAKDELIGMSAAVTGEHETRSKRFHASRRLRAEEFIRMVDKVGLDATIRTFRQSQYLNPPAFRKENQ